MKQSIFKVFNKYGAIHIVINWAGVFDIDPIIRTKFTDFKTVSWGLTTNSIGSVYTSLFAIRYFMLNEGRDKGVIINVSSMIWDKELIYLSKHFKDSF